jgi:HAD superfamily hydrolase (TIGR01509 family)
MQKSVMPQEIKAVIFDLDGTLIDSEPAWFAACNDTMRRYRKKEIAWEDYERVFVGVPVRKNIEMMFPDFPEYQKEDATAFYKNGFVANLGLVTLKHKATELLELVKTKGMRCALVTNTPREIVERILERFHLGVFFQVTVCEGEAPRSKPFPDPIIKACSLIDVVPSEIIYVEDSVTGVKAGKSAGAYTVAIGNEESKRKLKVAGARKIFEGLDSLYVFVERSS